MRRGIGGAIVAVLALAHGAAWGAETRAVMFPSAVSHETIPATLRVPDGAGPFPAIVIMHDCSGLGPKSSGASGRWADELVRQGYAVLLRDSFTPRGLPAGTCREPPARARVAGGEVRAADAYGALAFLRGRADIDGRHVGIMGGSHGGMTVMTAMYQPTVASNPLLAAKENGFAAAVALYPVCAGPFGAWRTTRANGRTGPIISYAGVYKPVAPVLVLVGDQDNWTPAAPCQRLVETAQRADYPMSIKVYPGAQHSFDSYAPMHFDPTRTNANMSSGHGATTGGDPAAWADAKLRLAAFFARYLKGQP